MFHNGSIGFRGAPSSAPKRLWAAAAVSLPLLLPASSLPAADLHFSRSTVLPGIGLQLRLMPDVTEKPLPPETVYPYWMSDGTVSNKVEMYSPYELWCHSQQAAQWTDADGNTLTLGTITHRLPGFTGRPHVLKRDYEARLAACRVTAEEWTDGDLHRWVTDFTHTPAQPQAPLRRLPQFARLVAFTFQDQPRRLGYAFRLYPSQRPSLATNWFFALIDLGPQVDLKSAAQAVERQFLPYLAPVADAGEPANAPTPDATPEKAESRRQVAASIANMKGWWYVETKNYLILSNLGRRNRQYVRNLQSDLETLRAGFERVIPPRVPVRAVSVIRVFNTPEEYTAYVGADQQWTTGLWLPSRQELVIRPPDGEDTPEKQQRITRAIYHEALHQHLFYALDQASAAAWFNEGHASLFEDAVIRNGRITLGEDPEKSRILGAMTAENRIDLSRLLGLSHEAFYAGTNKDRTGDYVLAWALVYYLRKAPAADKPAAYGNILPRYEEALWKTGNPDQATRDAFAGIDGAVLQRDFNAFWQSAHKRAAAARNDPFRQ